MVVAVIVYIQEGQRRIPIQYASRVRGRRMYQGGATFLPLRVNQAGVIPIIFAVSILLFPSQIASYFQTPPGTDPSQVTLANQIADGVVTLLSPNGWAYVILYFLLTVGFTYFYTAFTFKPDETADQLRKNGGFIPGIRPGAPTRDYLARVVFRLSLAGAVFLGTIAVAPVAIPLLVPGRLARWPCPRRHGVADRGLGRGRDDEADRGAADDAQLRGLHSLRVYVMVGAPGAGKGTQAALLAERLGIPHVASGDIFRDHIRRETALGKKVKSYMDQGALVPDDVTVQMIADRLRQGRRGRRGHPRRLPAHPAAGRGARRDACQAGRASDCGAVRRCRSREAARAASPAAGCAPKGRTTSITRLPARRRRPACATSTVRRSISATTTSRRRSRRAWRQQLPPMFEVVDYYSDRGVLSAVDGDHPVDEVTDELMRAIAQPAR